MWRGKAFWAAALLLGFSFLLGGAEDTSTVTIQVLNPHDRPVDNAEVILDFLGSHQVSKLGRKQRVHWETRTDQQGIAHFPSVPQGSVRLQINSPKYQTFGEKYEVDADQKRFDVKLNDPQPQYSAHPPLKPKDQ